MSVALAKGDKMAKPTLDEILEKLDPDLINEKIEQPHADARASYASKKTKVKAWEEFRKEVIDYVKHHHKQIYKADIDDARAYQIADRILSKSREEGGTGGIASAYSSSMKGKLQETFNLVHKGMEGEHIDAYNTDVFGEADPLDFDLSESLAKQYIDKYSSMLPPKVAKELKKKKPGELANVWPTLARQHTQVVYGHRDIVKKYQPAETGGGR